MTDTRVIDEVPSAVTEDFAVQVRDLRMSYGSTELLRGVDFDVRYGEVFCLLGPNGAGKTTTLEILQGLRRPAGGTARVLGLNPAAHAAKLRERVGMVLQECGFPRQARVAELIDIWRSYYPRPRPLGELLDVVELADVRNAQVRKLSGGQRRRLQAGRIELAGTTREVAARAGLATRISFTTPSALRRGQVALPDGVGLAVAAPSLEDTYLQLTGPDSETT